MISLAIMQLFLHYFQQVFVFVALRRFAEKNEVLLNSILDFIIDLLIIQHFMPDKFLSVIKDFTADILSSFHYLMLRQIQKVSTVLSL